MSTDIGQIIADLQRRLAKFEAQSRLKSASIDDAALVVRDGTGSLRGIVGQQGDGTTAVTIVNGPPPPTPSAPIVASVLGGVAAAWNGQFTDGQMLPLDWSRVEVHASTDPGFLPAASTLHSTIETAQGATVIVATDDPVYVRLLARTTSGTASQPSAPTGPYGPTPVVATDLLDGIVTTVKLADDAVTTAKVAVGAIGTTEIGDDAITTPKLVAGSVQTAQLDAEAVNASKIAAGAVTTLKLDALAVTTDKIAANNITTSKLAAGSVDATALKADAITGKIITGGEVVGAVVTGGIVQTGSSGQRIVLNPQATDPSDPTTTVPAVELHSGAAAQTAPGFLSAQASDGSSAYPYASLRSPAVANIGPNGQAINSEMRLLSSEPGLRGGSFSLDANANPYNSDSGASRIYGYTANGTTDTSALELRCTDGANAPGGTGILGPRTYILMSGSEIRMRARNSTADFSMFIRPTGITVEGHIVADAAWSTLTPASGWAGYGGNYGPGRFRLMPDGSIVLRDLMRRTATTTIANGETIATLPVGYRPTTYWQQTAWVGGTTGGSLAVNIIPDGTITLTGLTSGAITYLSTGSGFLSLNNYSYFLD